MRVRPFKKGAMKSTYIGYITRTYEQNPGLRLATGAGGRQTSRYNDGLILTFVYFCNGTNIFKNQL
ncbi:MAG: hypothetical protein CFE36_07455 [Sphingomonadaceae bacterium PASS1]|nr:MAG: hypothetical protein CFE36_07455 [Sphingomonadaceae bacterium PASS1]